jgi:hypothetical protein
MWNWPNRRSIRRDTAFAICTVALSAALGIVALHAAQGTAATPPPPDLRGVWRVVSYVRDGQPVEMDAMMIITGNHFSRVESERNRNKLEGIDFRRTDALTPAQMRLVAEAFPKTNAAAGTYRIENNVFYFTSVTHHNPAAVGHEAKRTIDLQGDRLTLSGPAGSGVLREVWERIEKQP